MSRFNYVPTVQMLPGNCMLCGKAQDPQGFVDTQVTIDGYGQCAICYTCTTGLQAAFNLDAMARPLITDSALNGVESLNSAVKELKEKYDNSIDNLSRYVDGLSQHFSRCAEILGAEYDARVRAGRIPTNEPDSEPEPAPGERSARENRIAEPVSKQQLGFDFGTSFDPLDDAD